MLSTEKLTEQAIWVIPACFAVLMVMACIKCRAAARRPDTNAASEMGLFFAYATMAVGFAASACVIALNEEGKEWLENERILPIAIVAGALVPLLALAGVYESIKGMVEMQRQEGIANRGRAASVVGLLLGTVFLAGSTAGVAVVARDQLRGEEREGGELLSSSKPIDPVELPAINAAFAPLDRGWSTVRVDREQDPELFARFRHASPRVECLLHARQTEITPSLESLAEDCLAELRSIDPDTTFEWSPTSVDGIEGLAGFAVARRDERTTRSTIWIGSYRGFVYRIDCMADDEVERAALERLSVSCRRGFRLLDRNAASPTALQAGDELASAEHGFSIRLDREWQRWDASRLLAPYALERPMSALVVVPVDLTGLDVEDRAVATGLLRCLSIDKRDRALSSARAVTGLADESLRALEFDYHNEIGDSGRFDYRIRVLRDGTRAWMVAAWSRRASSDAESTGSWLSAFRVTARTDDGNVQTAIDAAEPDERVREATLLASIARSLFDAGRFGAASKMFERVTQWTPQDAEMHLMHLASLCQEERFDRVPEVVERALALTDREALEIRSYRAFARLELGRDDPGLLDEGIDEYLSLYREGYTNWTDLQGLTTAMSERGRDAEGLELLESLRRLDDSETARIAFARAELTLGRPTEAIRSLEALLAEAPNAHDAEWALLELCASAEQHERTRSMAASMIERGQDSADAFIAKAKAEFELGWYRQAKETLTQGLERHARDPYLLDQLEIVQGGLGEGSNRLIRTLIEPVALPSGLPRPESIDTTDDAAIYLDHQQAVSFRRGTRLKRSEYTAIRVLTSEGVNRFSSFDLEFDPLRERMYVNFVRVRDENDEIVNESTLADLFVLDAETPDGIATQDKRVHVAVPGLAPGRTIEMLVTYQQIATAEEFPFLSFTLAESVPVERSVVTLRGDIDDVVYTSNPGVRLRADADELTWIALRPQVAVAEPLSPDPDRYLPTVRIAARGSDWARAGDDYLNVVRERLDPDEDELAELREVLDSIDDPAVRSDDAEERADAIARFVRDTLRYEAIEFGARGLLPDPPLRVLSNRYGDCKDHSLLLYSLLRAAGIDASLALVNAGGVVEPSLPSSQQFDHMVVYREDSERSAHVYDCTAKHDEPSEPVPFQLARKNILVLEPEASRLVALPQESGSTIESWRTVTLESDGTATVQERLEFYGPFAAAMRGYYEVGNDEARQTLLKREAARDLRDVEIDAVSIEHLEDTREPLILSCEYRAGQLLDPDGNTGRIGPGLIKRFLQTQRVGDRRAPLSLSWPLTVRGSVRLTDPESRLEATIAGGEELWRDEFGVFRSRVRRVESELMAEFVWKRVVGEFPAERYEDLLSSTERVRDSIVTSVRRVVATPGK